MLDITVLDITVLDITVLDITVLDITVLDITVLDITVLDWKASMPDLKLIWDLWDISKRKMRNGGSELNAQ